ncbi:hypothetical protein EYC84_007869 [Monilinia fructicola]|uniref:Uncharacterized protein n=1 Tax=Monilinia fructicola TaxID=38448 RepID=A0A5M9JJQ7_MONFR|nr:hypothetical protein EYC84_007869 [Monilinia fructicola]
METVNNIAAAASKAIWGEPQETVDAANATVVPETKGAEPLSGELGDTNKGEPYDKGNLDSTSTDLTNANTSTNLDPTITASPNGLGAKSLDPSTSTTTSSTGLPAKTIADTHIDPLSSSSDFETTSEKPLISERINPNLPSATDTPEDAKAKKEWNSETPTSLPIRSERRNEKIGVTDPHNPSLTTQTKDIKPSAPIDHSAAVSNTDKGKGVDVSGPGPRTLEEIARENGGTVSSASTGTSKPSSTANIQGVKTDLKPLGEKNKSETIEEGVEEAGPGAGREADRLLGREGKVEKTEVGGDGGFGEPRKSVGSELEDEHGDGKKEGKLTHLKEKIKEKLHKH